MSRNYRRSQGDLFSKVFGKSATQQGSRSSSRKSPAHEYEEPFFEDLAPFDEHDHSYSSRSYSSSPYSGFQYGNPRNSHKPYSSRGSRDVRSGGRATAGQAGVGLIGGLTELSGDFIAGLKEVKLSKVDNRLFPLFVVFIGLTLVLCGRVAWFQVVKHSAYAEEAHAQRTRDITIPARRGTIYDRQGNVLAKSVDAKTVYANPAELKPEQIPAAAKIISDELGIDHEQVFSKLTRSDKTFVYIEHKIETGLAQELISKLKEAQIKEGIYLLQDSRRIYPYGSIGGQVIGAVNRDGEGLSGLEKYYDEILRGTDGELLIQRGAQGQPIAGGVEKDLPAQDGQDIIVSIDVEIQQQAEKSVASTVEKWSAVSGTAVVADPRSGEILAVCSTPYLDPADLKNASPDALRLRAVSDAYEPGSTFKPLTAAMAINEGRTDPNKSYTIPPSIKVGTHNVRDVNEHGTIYLNLREILMQSSNIGITLVQRELGSTLFRDYLLKLHFGERSGIDFGGESAGIIASDKDWGSANAGFNSFGQGISMTPIQMVRAMSAIANEGKIRKPHFLVSKDGERVEYPAPERVFTADTARRVADMMGSVVSDGTGKNGRIEGYAISGKTGTAQRANPNGRGYLKGSNTANFIGFGPSADPAVLVYVVIDGTPDGFGGTTAGPAFREIMKVALKRLNIAPNDLKAYNEGAEHEKAQEKQEEEQRERLIEKNGTTQEKEADARRDKEREDKEKKRESSSKKRQKENKPQSKTSSQSTKSKSRSN